MQIGLTLGQLAKEIERQKPLKLDLKLDTQKAKLVTVKGDTATSVALMLPDHGRFPLQPVAHDQVGMHCGVPAKYYDRMLRDAPDLLAANVNTWFKQKNERRMLRTLDGNARAFVSDRYQRIENDEIADVALPIMLEAGLTPKSMQLTERRMYIQVVNERLFADVKVGDTVQAGIILSNSEVGLGSVTVAAMTYRLRCLNGMVSEDKFSARHVGRLLEEDVGGIFADDTRAADDKAVLLKVRDMVRAAIDEGHFNRRVERMRELATTGKAKHPEKAVEVLAQKISATDSERGSILAALIEGADLTAWGFLNATTAQAHTTTSYDRGVDFEKAGGKLLNLPHTEWRQILEAA